ncbi:Trk system potassium transporter TrkA [Kaustia mangrovi]|uniref:Trk system potassium uptake protein TrkA n=1 Tax=Kaustia mangrovi TaxID=2593653 RepID=A0A7S8C1I0_9HYPH|nr:Trk system potassium transporter TrkA [Kaustia mangrovi]QPC41572.1 Trk system potassium transporter TrkA [Kaustia mangrovi]
MKIIICGAGQVGRGIAERLAHEQNDVTVIDSSPQLVQAISDALDVQGVVGHGSHPDVLESAGARDADMLIAVTFADEVNMMACQIAHSLFEIPTKIARVRAQSYLNPEWRHLFSRENMPIDVVISPEIAVGEMVLRRLALPGAFEAIHFVDDAVIALGIRLREDCPVVDTPLAQLTELFPDLQTVVVGVVRDGQLFVPHGSDQMLVGDDVYVIADRAQAERVLGIFGHEEKPARRVLIAGGGNIGLYVATKLEERQSRTQVKIIEGNRQRAVRIAEELRRTVVLHGSTLEQEMLREAGAPEAEAFVALTNDDKVNILAAVMAKQEGARQTFSLVTGTDFNSILDPLNIDAYISPRSVTVSSILRHVRRGRIRGVHPVHNGQGEVLEAEALETSPVVGRPLREASLPDGVRIGALVRGGRVIIPTGQTEIKPHDRIVMFALAGVVREVEHLFRVSLEYF